MDDITRGAVKKDPAVYNTDSDSFQRAMSWTDEKEMIANAVAACIPSHSTSLLDIGAGSGDIILRLRNAFDEVTAIEPSERLFRVLSQRVCAPAIFPKVCSVIHSTFESALLANTKYDVVLASYSFRYIADQRKQLERIRDELLRTPGGTFVLVDLAPDSRYWSFYLPCEKCVRGIVTDPKTYDYTTRLGDVFARVDAHKFSSTMRIPNVDAAIGILDFIYDVETPKISADAVEYARRLWSAEYGHDRPMTVHFDHVAYVCRSN